jgi:hypothetical protein
VRSIRHITFDVDTVTIAWVDLPSGIRENGMLSGSLVVPIVDEMVEAFDSLQEIAEEILGQALKFFQDSETLTDRAETDEDEASPYDNPVER